MESSDGVTKFCDSVDLSTSAGQKRLLGLARVAEAAERYTDMCSFMKKLVEYKCLKSQELAVEERNLLSVAYKNVVGSKRSSWRTLSSNPKEALGIDSSYDDKLGDQYKKKVEDELRAICKEVIALLGPDINANVEAKAPPLTYGKNTLLQAIKDSGGPTDDKGFETKTFYLKMVGDYCRYLAEINDDIAKKYTSDYYEAAWNVAKDKLQETHPTRLGLALNYSVCHYEIMKEPTKACELAKAAFDSAIEKLDTLNDASYKDSTLIMQLLRDNLTLWTSEATESGGQEENP